MFIHLDTLAAIRSRVETDDSPWAEAYEAFTADVQNAMSATPESVTDNGDGHEFKAKGPEDPEARKDYVAAIRTGDWIRDLGLAYQYTGSDQYAEKAIELLDHWFLDSETRMAPVTTNSIELFITLPKMWWGAELVRGHDGWNNDGVASEADLQEWIRTFLDDVGHEIPTSFGQQNIFNWQEMTHAAGSVYLRDWDQFRNAIQRNREDGFNQLREDGLLENEIVRASSLAYSLYAAKALVTAAELSRVYVDRLDGPTLYEHQKFSGDTGAIERILDAHAPYVGDPEAWEALGEGDPERFANEHGFPARKQEAASSLYEVAYSYYEKDTYLETLKQSGQPVKNVPTYASAQQAAINDPDRPHRDERILGWTTFTHGERFRLDR
ncbi:alginate lyase family protein [Haloarcula terrestris]|nr:alginate lyase family protein [Haloarcula terrestris]